MYVAQNQILVEDHTGYKIDIDFQTGIVSGGVLSINANPAKYDITAGVGYVVDNYTNPFLPAVKKITWGTQTGKTLSTINVGNVTLIGYNSMGTIVENKPTDDLVTSFRNMIMLGVLIHIGGSIVFTNPAVLNGGALYSDLGVADISFAIGGFSTRGNKLTPNGANLNINKTAGTGYTYGINLRYSIKNPNFFTSAAMTPMSFQYVRRGASGTWILGSSTTTIDANHYDLGDDNLIDTIPNNKWSVQRVYISTTNNVIQYGQASYATRDDAVLGITTEDFIPFPDIAIGGLFLGYIVIKDSCTALNDATKCIIVNATVLGGSAVIV